MAKKTKAANEVRRSLERQLVGSTLGQDIAIIENALVVGWGVLSTDDQDTVLRTWLRAWTRRMERPNPQPAAVTMFDARRPSTMKLPRGVKVPLVGPTITGNSRTYDERDKLHESMRRLEVAAGLLRELAFTIILEREGEAVDARIVYRPEMPVRKSSAADLRERVQKSLCVCLDDEKVWTGAHLLWWDEDREKLSWSDIGLRDPAFLDVLAIRLALVARLLGDMALFALGVPETAKPSKKKNQATRDLLGRLSSLRLDKSGEDDLKRRVALMAVEEFNVRYTGERVIDLQRSTASEDERKSIKDHAKDGWLEHLKKSIPKSEARLRSA